MDYKLLIINNFQVDPEIIIGLLSQFPFESFQEIDDRVEAYIQSNSIDEELDVWLKENSDLFNFDFSWTSVKNENWNQIWESSFDPVRIGDFCLIRADFHAAVQDVKYDIVINPKMAFGTGHHETTSMVVEMMESIDFKEKEVFDFGCGTGILAILAEKLGAKSVLAIDNDINSIENARENGLINTCSKIAVEETAIQQVEKEFDIILANINRSVLLKYREHLQNILKNSGILIISGILKEDESIIRNEYESEELRLNELKEKDGWLAMHFYKVQ